MCIYLLDQENLTYTAGEHIFPAGLGGKRKLPNHFVSDQFNNLISKTERVFMQESLASLPRQFEGPGKRGKLGVSNASTSRVHVITDTTELNSFSLGYMKLGKPYLISYITLDRGTGHFTLNFDHTEPKNPEELRADFIEKLKLYNPLALKVLTKDRLPENLILFGFQVKRKKEIDYFLAKHPASDFELKPEHLAEIARFIDDLPLTPNTQSFVPLSSQEMIVRPNDDFRIPAKIAFNALADLIGYEKARRTCFDEIREWIANGGEVKSVKYLPASPLGDTLNLPESAHLVLFQTNNDKELFAIVTMYKSMHFIVRLGVVDDDISLPGALPGRICDWQKSQEYTIEEFLRNRHS